ncbi:FLYWCH zinc finger domain-containing protein [Phthorimaea operculella]|nr:FLYWCH zinc finger domain-containing protein [Phthorimaea operculella]
MAICDGYAYYHQRDTKSTMRWSCLRKPFKCRAHLTTDMQRKLVHGNMEHNHPQPKFNPAGRQLALISGYTYYLNNNSWRCTKGHSCRARFLLDKQMNMVSSNFQHDHTAPRYIIRNGVYFKI